VIRSLRCSPRRTAAPKASATGRDRNPRCSQDCSRDAPRHPGMSEYRMGRRCGIRPARRPSGAQECTRKTPRAQFRSRLAICRRALPALANKASAHSGQLMPPSGRVTTRDRPQPASTKRRYRGYRRQPPAQPARTGPASASLADSGSGGSEAGPPGRREAAEGPYECRSRRCPAPPSRWRVGEGVGEQGGVDGLAR
jgi:hypothetical protein